MLTADLTRLANSFPEFLRARASKQNPRQRPMPTWIDDPELSRHLLKDTGLTPEDLGRGHAYNEAKSILTKQNYW